MKQEMQDDDDGKDNSPPIVHSDPYLPGEAHKDRLTAESPPFRKEPEEHHS